MPPTDPGDEVSRAVEPKPSSIYEMGFRALRALRPLRCTTCQVTDRGVSERYDGAAIAWELGYWQFKLFGWMFSTFGAVSLLLAVTGVDGVLSYSVSRRTQEIGRLLGGCRLLP